ncbi:MAG: NHLP family bacteriocin export ABC transporter peptidase/permease/ATPase subunit [Tildeniella nuda ZEHNDER 1965/U140]|jgi:ATP-binding cassette subfamily C protein|nr:NHLP family bacteriocin export ABC transporter peptidase/permease/ATPase subunit [Tildeniella nuda ZEHNDER 1965/U140]
MGLLHYPLIKTLDAQLQQWLVQRRQGRSRRVRTPTVLQMEAVECGAAALGILLSYYGRIVPLAELRQACGVSRDGSTAANLIKAAKRYGLVAKGFKKGLEALQNLRCPYVVFWNFNHFLVVEGWGHDRVYLNDPATGPRSITFQEFDEAYTGVVLVMEPGADFRKGGRKPSLMRSLRDRLQGSVEAVVYCLLAGLLLVIPGLAVPVFTQIFVDNILVEGHQDWLRPLLLGMLMTVILKGFLSWLQLRHLRRLKIKLAVKMSSHFLWHILRLPVSFYAQRYAGEIANRTSLNDKVADVLSGQLAVTAIDVVMMVFYALVMLQYDKVLTAIGMVFAGMNLVALQWVSRQRVDANIRLGMENGKVAGVAISGLQSIETLKSSALESDFFSRWSGYYTKVLNSQQELGIQNQVLSVLPTLLSQLAAVLLLVVGGFRVMDGNLSIGMLVAFQSLMQSFLEPVKRLVNLGSTLQEFEGDLSRLEDVLSNAIDPQLQETDNRNLEKETTASFAPTPTRYPSDRNHIHAANFRLQGAIELRNITFGYTPINPALIEDFNLTIQPGQRIALVGGSGSGKSTVVKLITGLYQPWSGEIYLDGQPLAQIPRRVLTHSLALIEQDLLLFAGTVRENLTLWDSTVRDRNLIHACKDAVIHDVVLSLPGGYDAELIEGGVNLSGGQRQRLEIARALVHNPSILVMDEATSALDSETEKMINRNLRRRGCTCIIVAHRLSTIRDCDEIIVFDQGQVVERGTHDALYQTDGVYAQLIQSESQ